jgi:GntR family transcriptional regulator
MCERPRLNLASPRNRLPDLHRLALPCDANDGTAGWQCACVSARVSDQRAANEHLRCSLAADAHREMRGAARGRAIADGEAKPGERLPPDRDLAAVLGVNTNTVLRSLRLLREEGLLEFRRGRGVTVAGTPEKGAVIARARELVRFARQQGYRRDELIRLIEDIG